MASDINYDIYTVPSGAAEIHENTLLQIAGKYDLNVKTLQKLNPNYAYNEALSDGTQVLRGVGAMTDTYDGFGVSTLTVKKNEGSSPLTYTITITDGRNNNKKYIIDNWPCDQWGGSNLSLDTIVNNKAVWYHENLSATTLQKLNPWLVSQMVTIVSGKIVLLEVFVPGQNSAVTISNFGILTDTTRTVYVTWDWSHKANGTKSFDVKWEWQSSDGNWLNYSTTTESSEEGMGIVDELTKTYRYASTHNADEKAVAVRVSIKPVAETGKNTAVVYKWQTQTQSFKGSWQVATPSTPTVEIKNYLLTATLDGLPVKELGIDGVQFDVRKNDDMEKCKDPYTIYEFSDNDKAIGNGYIQFSMSIDAGSKYRVRARCMKYFSETNKNKVSAYYSGWSDFSNYTYTIPTAPELKECKVVGMNDVRFKWSKVNSADGYTIEYIAKDENNYKLYDSPEAYFDGNPSEVISVSVDATKVTAVLGNISYVVADIPVGATYLARVKSVNSDAESKYSNIMNFILGTESEAPTTWSSSTSVGIGEPLRLYWVHNSTDGSKESSAHINFTNLSTNDSAIATIRKTSSNTIASIAADNKITVQTIRNYNPHLSKYTDNRTLEPGTIVRTTSLNFVFVEVEDEEITSHFIIDTDGSRYGGTGFPYNFYDGNKFTWKVQTAGVLLNSDKSLNYGEWSIERTVDVYAPPTLEIALYKNDGEYLDDENPLRTLPFKAVLSVGNTTNQTPTGYYVSVVAANDHMIVDEVGNEKAILAGTKVFSRYYDSTETSKEIEFKAKDLSLTDGETYYVYCSVAMSSGLVAEARSNDFVVGWVYGSGYYPSVEIGVDKDTLTSRIRVWAQNAPETVQLFVYRINHDGTFIELETDSDDPESGLLNTGSVWITDPHPGLDYARYRVVARDPDTGVIQYMDASKDVREKSVVIQWDEEWQTIDLSDGDTVMKNAGLTYTGSMLKIPYNIDVSNAHSPDVSLVRYIGRKRPVSYYGTHLGETATWNMVIPKSDKETLYALRRLAIYMGDVYVREPSGSGYWASINISFSQAHLDLTIPVTINITPVEGGI